MPSISSFVIAALWAASIWSAAQWAPDSRLNQHASTPSPMLAIISVLPVLFFGAMALCGPRQSPFFQSKLAQWINARYGPHTFESFLVRLKPLLMFGTAGALQGVIGLWHGRHVKPADDIASGFLLSAGVGFAVAHVILYLRRAVAVFPTWAIAQPVPKPAHKTLRDALRVYWWALI